MSSFLWTNKFKQHFNDARHSFSTSSPHSLRNKNMPSIMWNIVKNICPSLQYALRTKRPKWRKNCPPNIWHKSMSRKYLANFEVHYIVSKSYFLSYPNPLGVRKPSGVAFGGCLMVEQIVSWDINCQVLRFGLKKQKDSHLVVWYSTMQLKMKKPLPVFLSMFQKIYTKANES